MMFINVMNEDIFDVTLVSIQIIKLFDNGGCRHRDHS